MGEWRGIPHADIPRCGAKTRAGGACGHYAMPNSRCRIHGGKSTGPRDRRKITKHGHYTKEAIEERRLVGELIEVSGRGIKLVEYPS